jgi:hypothetical protein
MNEALEEAEEANSLALIRTIRCIIKVFVLNTGNCLGKNVMEKGDDLLPRCS